MRIYDRFSIVVCVQVRPAYGCDCAMADLIGRIIV